MAGEGVRRRGHTCIAEAVYILAIDLWRTSDASLSSMMKLSVDPCSVQICIRVSSWISERPNESRWGTARRGVPIPQHHPPGVEWENSLTNEAIKSYEEVLGMSRCRGLGENVLQTRDCSEHGASAGSVEDELDRC